MELSPEALRDARFTERFRGYDAAEVDAFLNEAAEALEELVAERSEPMAALAAERARLAIEEVRRQTLEEVTEVQHRRDELAQAVADLQLMLADRRLGLVGALALIDAASEPAPDPGDGAEAAGSRQDETEDDGDTEAAPEGDSFLARLERAAEAGDSSG
ncbi:MAG: DivIVA domain-containing protein [Acidimicrobiia bacterium]|nr:DivIVA domain-containing protein [Acidimicrobiia bacterium]